MSRLVILVALHALAAQSTDAQQPPFASHVVIYDASGSMYRADTGEYRYRLAQTVARRLAEGLRQSVAMPTGMLVFGRRYFQALRRCDDVEIVVPISPIRGTDTLDRIAAEAARSLPNGQTPLLPSMVEAAKQMPPGRGLITVITDLDEETCGGDPCSIAEELRRIGKPLGSLVDIGFIVATGLQRGTNTQTVERFSRCVGGRLLVVGTIAEAQEAADVIVAALAPTAAQAPPQQIAQANAGQAEVEIRARFSAPVDLPGWAFSEADVYVEYQANGRERAPLQGNQSTISVREGTHTFNLARGADLLGAVSAVQIKPGKNHVDITLDPARINAHATPDATTGERLKLVRFDWTLEGYGRQVLSSTHGPDVTFSVPPGQYVLSVAISGGGVAGKTPQRASVVVRAGQVREVSFRFKSKPVGELVLHAEVQDTTAFSQIGSAIPIFVMPNAEGRSETIGEGWDPPSRQLDPGSYEVTARLGSYRPIKSQVTILPGEATSVRVIFVPSARIVVHPRYNDGSIIEKSDISWDVSRAAPPAVEPTFSGSVVDVRVPAGTYHVKAYSRSEGSGEVTVSVEDGDIAEEYVTLRR